MEPAIIIFQWRRQLRNWQKLSETQNMSFLPITAHFQLHQILLQYLCMATTVCLKLIGYSSALYVVKLW